MADKPNLPVRRFKVPFVQGILNSMEYAAGTMSFTGFAPMDGKRTASKNRFFLCAFCSAISLECVLNYSSATALNMFSASRCSAAACSCFFAALGSMP
ncbi:hypothetical protein [Candidatus Desulfovibrio trichonymphae]|uniref:hypothetical protein n=1 Tax=Candidatus Desulfovibrio trichonymphae TaxID=1725232 RepID=UPI001E594633|nr:hypothetical protein [Candidatus Desulfovibrio trichonymphae]